MDRRDFIKTSAAAGAYAVLKTPWSTAGDKPDSRFDRPFGQSHQPDDDERAVSRIYSYRRTKGPDSNSCKCSGKEGPLAGQQQGARLRNEDRQCRAHCAIDFGS